jgi:hypothetical protein
MKNSSGFQVGASNVSDPYHAWLGISEERRPCSPYDLLGLPPGERDESLIEAAAVSRAGQVRGYQLAHPAESTRLLAEIALAMDTLVNSVKRRASEAKRERLPFPGSAEIPPGPGETAPAPGGIRKTQPRTALGGDSRTTRPRRAPLREGARAPAPVGILVCALCDVVLCVPLGWERVLAVVRS